MKLKMIYERKPLNEEDDKHSISVSLQQSIKNLRVKTLIKLRKMLQAIGLTKENRRHSVIEPIGIAVSPFSNVRLIVLKKIDQDIAKIEEQGLNSPATHQIEAYWGFRFPTQWSDPYSSQIGMMTDNGEFDKLIQGIKEKAKLTAPNEKLLLLQDFVNSL